MVDPACGETTATRQTSPAENGATANTAFSSVVVGCAARILSSTPASTAGRTALTGNGSRGSETYSSSPLVGRPCTSNVNSRSPSVNVVSAQRLTPTERTRRAPLERRQELSARRSGSADIAWATRAALGLGRE